jgi:hypothetical protein
MLKRKRYVCEHCGLALGDAAGDDVPIDCSKGKYGCHSFKITDITPSRVLCLGCNLWKPNQINSNIRDVYTCRTWLKHTGKCPIEKYNLKV